MKHISEMEVILSRFFNWHKTRLHCLVQIIQALFYVRTVNLTQIAAAFQTKAKEASAYRRVCRFFTEFSFDLSLIVSIVLKLFTFQGKYTLIMDRTNWKWGKSPINILMISVAYLGIGIPIFWAVSNRGGTSSFNDRISLLKRVLEKFGTDRIEVFVADREFIGKEWFRFLSEKNIFFMIRVKKKFLAEGICNGCPLPLETLCRRLGRSRKIENFPVVLWGHKVYISIRKAKGSRDPLIITSNHEFKNPLAIYKRRWEIETLFGCLKTRGFCMEETHMVDKNKIEKLVFVLAIAFCWAYRAGELKARKKPITIKTHGRKAKSLFREGLDLIRLVLFQIRNKAHEFKRLLLYFHGLTSGGYLL